MTDKMQLKKIVISSHCVCIFFSRWTHLYIPLINPTHETLELEVENSNPSNFSTETDPKHPVSKICVLSQK